MSQTDAKMRVKSKDKKQSLRINALMNMSRN